MEKKVEKLNDQKLCNINGGFDDSPVYYRIVRGDTLSGIAKRNGTSVEELLKLNPHITNPDLIETDDTLRIR